MKLTDTDIQMFHSLRASELGKNLASFIERMEADVCDIRNFGEHDTIQSAQQASRALRDLRTRLNTQVGTTQSIPNEYV